MKVLGLVLMIALVSAENSLRAVSIGTSCDSAPTLDITAVTVFPWPVYASQQYQISVTGTFTAKEYVDQIYFYQRLNQGLWKHSYQTVKQNFNQGDTNTFVISLEGPSVKGTYTNQITFHRNDFSYCACWTFNFNIT